MRIAVVVCVYPPYRGGIGHAAQRQAAILRELGHEVVVYCPASPGERPGEEVVDGIPVHRLRPLLAYGNSALLPQLAGRMRDHDALFLHYPFFGGAEAAAARRAPAAHALRRLLPHGRLRRGRAGGVPRRLPAHDRPAGAARRAPVLVSSADYFRHSLQARRVRRVEPAPYGIDTARLLARRGAGRRPGAPRRRRRTCR